LASFHSISGVIKVNEDPKVNQESIRLIQLGLGTLLLTLLSLLFPTLMIIAPIPIGVLTYKRGMTAGLITALIASVSMWFFDPMFAGRTLLFLGVGIVIGGGYKEKIKPKALLALAIIVSVIAVGGAVYMFDFENWFNGMKEAAEGMNVDEEFLENLPQLYQLIKYTLPAYVLIGAGIFAYLNMFGVHKALSMYEEKTEWLKPFRYWFFPWVVATLYLLSLLILNYLTENTLVHRIIYNIEVLLNVLLVIQGASLAVYQSLAWKLHWIFLVLAIIVVIFTPFGLWALLFIGLVDSAFNLRRLPR
jgi:uncharacterized protein YybS (DUF2232 family)